MDSPNTTNVTTPLTLTIARSEMAHLIHLIGEAYDRLSLARSAKQAVNPETEKLLDHLVQTIVNGIQNNSGDYIEAYTEMVMMGDLTSGQVHELITAMQQNELPDFYIAR